MVCVKENKTYRNNTWVLNIDMTGRIQLDILKINMVEMANDEHRNGYTSLHTYNSNSLSRYTFIPMLTSMSVVCLYMWLLD
jgi:hypothetical protein